MRPVTDSDLLTRTRAGERHGFGTFYVRHREGVLMYLACQVRVPEVAADLMAETFARALVATLDGNRPLPDAPKAWLYGIARNLLIDALRRGKVDATARQRLGLEPLTLDDDDVERIEEIADAAQAVEAAADQLREAEWELLRARAIDDVPYGELAARLKCSEAVARKRVSRAMAHLRTAIGVDDV